MNHLLCFGAGFSAQALAAKLDRATWRITGTSRTDAGFAALNAQDIEGLRFDQFQTIPSSVTHIVSSVPPAQSGDPVLLRFGEELKQRAAQFTWVAYLSTTGVYGNHGGGRIDEDTPLSPSTERGHLRRVAEQAWSAIPQLPLHIFRLAGIYGPGRNQLETIRDGTARRIIKQGQVFSRIHVDDIAGILLASIARCNPGRAYNCADDEPCPPQDVVTFAAGLLGLPPPPEIRFEDAELSPMARSFYAESKRVANTRVKQELGFQFQYPTYREGLRALLTPSHPPALPGQGPSP
jgi:nucleoside-diphosphate-sugar epimerase